MKKLLCVVACATTLVVLAAVGCGKKSDSDTSTTDSETVANSAVSSLALTCDGKPCIGVGK